MRFVEFYFGFKDQNICSVTWACSFTSAMLILIWLSFEKIGKKNFSLNPCFERNPRCSKSSQIASVCCNNLLHALHQVARIKGKNSLRERRDIVALIVILNDCTTLILSMMCYPLSSYIQFKEVKILRGPEAG